MAADDTQTTETQEQHAGKPKDDAKQRKLLDVTPVTTAHELTVNGRTLSYHATTGAMPLVNEQGETQAQIFFMAYTLDTPEGDPKRPLTFAFNGGPGSSSIWLHMGGLGPKRVYLNTDGTMPPPPFRVVDNQETWLTETDLVFIDPVGTGFSRAAKPELDQQYWSYKGDIESVGEFIRLYLTRYGRWPSPLFLAGESYGTLRAAGLAGHLIEKGIAFNGIMLVSATLSFMTLIMDHKPGSDLPFYLYIPGYTATAWYHKRLPEDLQSRELRDVLDEAERWAMSDYLLALVKGDSIGDEERARTIEQLARYTGLSAEYIDNSNLRINIMRFCKELLRDCRRTVGRIDSRLTGVDVLAVTDMPDFDPSLIQPTAPFTAAFNDYVRNQLGVKTDLEYETLSYKVNEKWQFVSEQERMGFLETAEAMRKAFAVNPYMKVLVACGYYDLATPYSAITYTFNHLYLEPDLRANLEYTFYEAGHMMYIADTEREKLTRDAERFIRGAVTRG